MSIFLMNFRRNMKGAFKTVKSNFKEYVCFVLALIMVEVLFGVIAVCFFNNRTVEKETINRAGYTYHAYLSGITVSDANVIATAYDRAFAKDEVYFTVVNQKEHHILFEGNVKESRNRFQLEVINQLNAGSNRVSLIITPLYSYDVSAGSDVPGFIALLGLLGLLSFLLLMALFRIRINHFKFTYSIYMAFGADFKKLTQSAFYEVLLIALLSFLPALPLTYLISALIYLPHGNPFGFYPLSLPIMLLLPLICSLLALILPMRVLASGVPHKHMRAQDNSNYLRSVKRSKILLKKSVFHMEALAFWRFRKYIAILLLSTVSFAVLFNAGCYLADVYAERSEATGEDMTLTLTDSANYNLFKAYFDVNAKALGIKDYVLEKTASNPYDNAGDPDYGGGVMSVSPHLAIPKDRTSSAMYTPCPDNNDFYATEALDIRPFDEDAHKALTQVYEYTFEGDPSLLLRDPNTVIVSSSLANKPANTLKPGDIVMLPVDCVMKGDAQFFDEDGLSTLALRLENYVFTYRAFTVAAVVTNYADYTSSLLYLPAVGSVGQQSSYGAVMGSEPDYTTIKVHLENDEDKDTVARLVQNYIDRAGGISVSMDYGALENKILGAQNNRGMILILSGIVFCVCPIAGFFSQILFYQKRRLEFDVLRAVGADTKDLKKIFLVDGLFLAALSGVLYVLGTVGIIHLLCNILNSPYVFIFIDGAATASTFYPIIPPLPFLAGLILVLIFALGQVALPALQYKKSISDHIAADFATEDKI